MEVLKFIFSNFWTFLGTLILVNAIFRGIQGIIYGYYKSDSDKENNTPKEENNNKYEGLYDELEVK